MKYSVVICIIVSLFIANVVPFFGDKIICIFGSSRIFTVSGVALGASDSWGEGAIYGVVVELDIGLDVGLDVGLGLLGSRIVGRSTIGESVEGNVVGLPASVGELVGLIFPRLGGGVSTLVPLVDLFLNLSEFRLTFLFALVRIDSIRTSKVIRKITLGARHCCSLNCMVGFACWRNRFSLLQYYGLVQPVLVFSLMYLLCTVDLVSNFSVDAVVACFNYLIVSQIIPNTIDLTLKKIRQVVV